MASVAIARPALPLVTVPTMICAAMLCVSSVTWALGGPGFYSFVAPYFTAAWTACLTSICIWAFVEVVKLAGERADRPLDILWVQLRPKLPMLMLPAIVLPLFMAGFTATKLAMADLVGFRFDRLFADMDAAIFGQDPWRITHATIGRFGTNLIEVVYVHLWIAVLAYSQVLVALFAERRTILTFYTAMLATWFSGGFLFAYAMPTAGPIFFELTGMEWSYAELRMSLLRLDPDSAFISGHAYLLDGLSAGGNYPGSGISAMPSMHIAACAIYIAAARGTRWIIPAWLFGGAIFIGSVHSGYHYFVDGVAAAAIAALCWQAAASLYSHAAVKADNRPVGELV